LIRTNTGWYCNPNGYSKLQYINFGANRWHISEEGWQRIYYAWGSDTIYKGGNFGWSHNFRTHDDATRWIFEGYGNIYCNGNIVAYWSDERLKTNIKKIDTWKEILNGIDGYWYEWNEIGKKVMDAPVIEDGVQIGLIAQEVKKVLPQAVTVQLTQYKEKRGDELIPKDGINYDPDDPYLTVKQEKLIPVLVAACKGLMEENEDQASQLKEMKSFNEVLMQRLEALEEQMRRLE